MRKKLFNHHFLVLLLIFFAQGTHAEIHEQDCLPYTIVFGNGVGNTLEDAQSSRRVLSGIVGNSYKNVAINFADAYNPTGGPGVATLIDVVDVLKQKMAENNSLWSLSWKVIYGVVSKSEPNQSWVSTVSQTWTEYNKQVVQGMRYNLAQNSNYYDETVADHMELYKALLTNDENPQRVLLVAHSQGNLYGNIALQKVKNEVSADYAKRMAMVGVGSAADSVFQDGPYITSSNDSVINGLRFFYTGVLLGNIGLPAFSEFRTVNDKGEVAIITDYTGHGFVTTYTNPAYAGRQSIKDRINDQLNELSVNGDDHDFNQQQSYLVTERNDGGADDYYEPFYPVDMMYGCYDGPWGCQEGYNYYVPRLFHTKISERAGSPISLRWPGEPFEFDSNWYFPGNGVDALTQFVFPRIFDPSHPAYIGHSKKRAKIKFEEIKGATYSIAIYPLYGMDLIRNQIIKEKRVFAKINVCKNITD